MAERAGRHRLGRALWLVVGLVCVGLGVLGAVVPGVPTTVFFIAAASCFTRSSERLERWVLDLPGVGPVVRDHRAGLGMPRRAKRLAIATIVVVGGLSASLALSSPVARTAVVGLCGVGVAYLLWRVPTRERVLDARGYAPRP